MTDTRYSTVWLQITRETLPDSGEETSKQKKKLTLAVSVERSSIFSFVEPTMFLGWSFPLDSDVERTKKTCRSFVYKGTVSFGRAAWIEARGGWLSRRGSHGSAVGVHCCEYMRVPAIRQHATRNSKAEAARKMAERRGGSRLGRGNVAARCSTFLSRLSAGLSLSTVTLFFSLVIICLIFPFRLFACLFLFF